MRFGSRSRHRRVTRGRRQSPWWRFLFLLATAGLIVLPAFYRPVLVRLGEWLVHSESPRKADLIYVLAGDFWGNRAVLGAELGARGYARHVLFGGGAYQDSYQGDLSIEFLTERGYPKHLFQSVRLKAGSTIDEALEIEPHFRHLGAKRIILVTANYHSRRTALVFRLLLPGYEFQVIAAKDSNFNPVSWWKTEQGRRIFVAEWTKIAGTILLGTTFMHPTAASSAL